MRKIVAWPLVQAFYYIGHWAYLFIDRLDDGNDEEPGPVFNTGFRIYQGAMAWSWRLNDWAGLNVWKRPAE